MHELKLELEKAVEGLLYPSDADHPWKVDVRPCSQQGRFDPPRFLEFLGQPPDRLVEEQDVQGFFDELSFAPAFQKLLRVLRGRLTELQVFRVGRVRVEVYLIGRDSAGNLAVLSTRSLET